MLPNHFLAPSARRVGVSEFARRMAAHPISPKAPLRRRDRRTSKRLVVVSQWLRKSRGWCPHHETHQTNAPIISHDERMRFPPSSLRAQLGRGGMLSKCTNQPGRRALCHVGSGCPKASNRSKMRNSRWTCRAIPSAPSGSKVVSYICASQEPHSLMTGQRY